MRGITSREIKEMRAEIEDQLMPDVCTILSLTQTSDGAGSFTDAWGTVVTGIPCRFDPVGRRGEQPGERFVIASIQDYNAFVVTLPWDLEITTEHRIEYQDNQYNIRSVTNPSNSSWLVTVRAIVEKV